MIFSDKILHFASVIESKLAVKLWFRKNGDDNLRINYQLNQNSLVLDVGGYQGDWAVRIYDKYKCKILIFEPVEAYYKKISDRFYNNQQIQVFNFGLESQDTKGYISILDDGSSFYKGTANSNKVLSRIKDIEKFILERNLKKIELIKINIEGGEYDLLDKILSSGLIDCFINLQIQFHNFTPNSFLRRKKIQRNLSRTHYLTYNYPFVWENWRKK